MFRISKASVKIISEFRIRSHKKLITKKGLILERLHPIKINKAKKEILFNPEITQAFMCLLNQHDEIIYVLVSDIQIHVVYVFSNFQFSNFKAQFWLIALVYPYMLVGQFNAMVTCLN